MNRKIVNTKELKLIILTEFSDIVSDVQESFMNELRIILYDKSFIDIWFSINLENRYSYHWERKHIDGFIFRHDNIPHIKWKNISTFPKHFHNKSEEKVESSFISDSPQNAVREIMEFAKFFLRKG